MVVIACNSDGFLATTACVCAVVILDKFYWRTKILMIALSSDGFLVTTACVYVVVDIDKFY